MQTISKYFVALLVSFFSNYIDEPPSELDKQAGIHDTNIQVEKKTDCDKLKKSYSEFKNYI